MRTFIIAAAGLTASLAAAAPASAQSYHDHYRDWRQEQRIHDGWRAGQETPREYRQLQRQHYAINRYRHAALRDGYLSPGERRHLDQMQRRASRNIYRQRHDRQGYYGRGYYPSYR